MPIRTLFIDLDETLYPASCGVWEAISKRIEAYMHERMGVPQAEITDLRRSLYQQYGTTLHGLQVTRGVDTADFLAYVHDIPLASLLQPDPQLRGALLQLNQRKFIFTNADRPHAERVITQLGLQGCFDGIIDILDIAPHCKPMAEAFTKALQLAGESDAAQCAFIDDSPRNLAGARAAGFYTIQVGSPKRGFQHPTAAADAQIERLADIPALLKAIDS